MIDKLLTDISDTGNINPYYDKINNTNNDYVKMDVYNPKCIAPLHKYWFYLETSKIVSINKNKSTMLKVALSKTHNTDLIKYISMLESIIFEHCKTFKGDIIMKKTVGKPSKYPPLLNMKITSQSHIFNNNNMPINVDLLHENDDVSIYFELKNIWINTTTNIFWLDLCVLQIQTKQLIDLSRSLFGKELPEKKMLYCSASVDDVKSSFVSTEKPTTVDTKESFKGSFPPKLDDILHQRSKLRTTANKNSTQPKNETPLNKIVSNDTLVAQLSKLKTTKPKPEIEHKSTKSKSETDHKSTKSETDKSKTKTSNKKPKKKIKKSKKIE